VTHNLKVGDYIIILEAEIMNSVFFNIPLEIMGLQYQPNLAAVRVVNQHQVFPLDLDTCTVEMCHSSYKDAFLPKRETNSGQRACDELSFRLYSHKGLDFPNQF
jgi:hypothetical protein